MPLELSTLTLVSSLADDDEIWIRRVADTPDIICRITKADLVTALGIGSAGLSLASKSADYTFVLGDANGGIYHPVSDDNPRTMTIPSNASVAFPVNTTLTFVNDKNTITIAIDTDTLQFSEGSTGSRTLDPNGVATAIKVTSTRWLITGVNIS